MSLNHDERARAVEQMNANHAIEDSKPDADDLALQEQYIAGNISTDALLAHALEFAKKHGHKE